MNKEITIYELLGLVKDGKAPEKINYLGIEYKFMFQDYKDESRDLYLFSEEIKDITDILNDTVEIIEDNDKTDEEAKPITKESIEALGYACGEIQKCFTSGWTKALENKPLKGNDKLEKIEIMGEKIKTFYDGDTHFVGTNSKDRHFYIPILNKIIDHINKIEEALNVSKDN